MEKNTILIYSRILATLHNCCSFEELKTDFLPILKMLVPFSYASILLKDRSAHPSSYYLPDIYCLPEYFEKAEKEYLKYAEEDPLFWNVQGNETILTRESDLLSDSERLQSVIYRECYRQFHVYDSLQFCIFESGQLLGVLSLFNTKSNGSFTDEDVFFLQSMGAHFNTVFARLCHDQLPAFSSSHNVEALREQFGLTPRESEVLTSVYEFRTNEEIAEDLSLSQNTIQKHMQNIFRKMGVSSRWELLRF